MKCHRERHGWCPYSERVWLALEVKQIPYDTIKIDNTGHGRRPSYFSGQTPRMRWPENGKVQGESMDLVRELEKRYPDNLPNLYPDDIQSEVINKIRAFNNIFPKRARPSSRAAFLFRYDGEPLWKNEFEKVLKDTDELLSETAKDGPFFCGQRLTAADIAWAPFLERYGAQLPCLHDGLHPTSDDAYPHLKAWYQAMDTQIPAYSCRVKGDFSSWRKVLTMAGYGNAGIPPTVLTRMNDATLAESYPLSEKDSQTQQSVWDEYISSARPWMAATPAAEASSTIVRNRSYILKDILKRSPQGMDMDDEESIDLAIRALAAILSDTLSEEDLAECKSVSGVSALATFLDDRMCVPRDMGSMSAASIKRLAYELSN